MSHYLLTCFSIPMRMSFSDKLIKKGKRKLSRKFNLSYRHIDDLTSFDNKRGSVKSKKLVFLEQSIIIDDSFLKKEFLLFHTS